MPGHEIRKAFNLARRLYNAHVCARRSKLSQSAGYGEDQVGSSDSEDSWHEERDTEHSLSFQTEFRQRSVHRSLLTFPSTNYHVGKTQILFQRQTSCANLVCAGHQTNKVVNNAGIMPLSPIAKGDVATFDKVIATNLRGMFLVLARAAQHVSEGGRIIAFSSSVLAKAFPTYGAYIASKAGVEGLVHVLTNELRGRNITVNAVAPGPVGTDLFLKGKTQAQIEELSKLAPLERLGQPEDIANVVSFLAGPDGGWVNGQVLRANGGFA